MEKNTRGDSGAKQDVHLSVDDLAGVIEALTGERPCSGVPDGFAEPTGLELVDVTVGAGERTVVTLRN